MKQMQEEEEEKRCMLEADIERLQREVEQYSTNLGLWIEKCRGLERVLASERKAAGALNDSNTISTDAVPLSSTTNPRHDAHEPSLQEEASDIPMGCGNCTAATSCQCIDEAFNVLNATTHDAERDSGTKRPHSPGLSGDQKRVKPEPHDALEIDFTAIFSQPGSSSVPRPPDTSHDTCGFCQDGTPCICAEMAAESERDRAAATSLHNAALQQSSSSSLRPAMNQLAQFTPPPSEGDVASTPQRFQNALATASSNPCVSGPGTCAQCRSDPNSTLFCKALHASRSQSGVAREGCCGGSTVMSNGCCQNQNISIRTTRSGRVDTAAAPSENPKVNAPSITLTCADAYTTLSRHPGYERASGDIASWMPKLNATTAAAAEMLEGRPAMEIDAANVMSVLKDFDRRFS